MLNFKRHFAGEGQTVLLSSSLMQPIASDDVAAAVTGLALAEPLNGVVEIAGPEPIRMDEFARRFLSATRDPRKVITDVHAQYFGTELNDQSLVPGDKARLGPTHFADWLSRATAQQGSVNLGRGGRSHDTQRSAAHPGKASGTNSSREQPNHVPEGTLQ